MSAHSNAQYISGKKTHTHTHTAAGDRPFWRLWRSAWIIARGGRTRLHGVSKAESRASDRQNRLNRLNRPLCRALRMTEECASTVVQHPPPPTRAPAAPPPATTPAVRPCLSRKSCCRRIAADPTCNVPTKHPSFQVGCGRAHLSFRRGCLLCHLDMVRSGPCMAPPHTHTLKLTLNN